MEEPDGFEGIGLFVLATAMRIAIPKFAEA
jgi:hypothetical protein